MSTEHSTNFRMIECVVCKKKKNRKKTLTFQLVTVFCFRKDVSHVNFQPKVNFDQDFSASRYN